MANHLETRKVVTVTEHANGRTETESWEYRTKDVTASLLGLIPLASSWGAWTPLETTTVYRDQEGNPV